MLTAIAVLVLLIALFGAVMAFGSKQKKAGKIEAKSEAQEKVIKNVKKAKNAEHRANESHMRKLRDKYRRK